MQDDQAVGVSGDRLEPTVKTLEGLVEIFQKKVKYVRTMYPKEPKAKAKPKAKAD